MANEFFTILTATGRNKLAAATATGAPLTLTQMAVGDGDNGAYYSPTEAQTALKHEVWRGAMIAVGKFPESYKPTLAAGSNKQDRKSVCRERV